MHHAHGRDGVGNGDAQLWKESQIQPPGRLLAAPLLHFSHVVHIDLRVLLPSPAIQSCQQLHGFLLAVWRQRQQVLDLVHLWRQGLEAGQSHHMQYIIKYPPLAALGLGLACTSELTPAQAAPSCSAVDTSEWVTNEAFVAWGRCCKSSILAAEQLVREGAAESTTS